MLIKKSPLVLLLALALLALACPKKALPAEDLLPNTDPNAERIENVEILYSDSSIVRVRVKGPLMINHTEYSNPYQEFLEGIQVEFFDVDGNITSTLTARYAIRQESKGMTIFRQDVLWLSDDQKTLETPELIWDERDQRIYSRKFAVVTTLQDTVYSHGFEASQNFKNIKLNAVDGSVNMDQLPTSGE